MLQQRLKALLAWSRDGNTVVLDYGPERLRISSVHPGTLRLLLQRHPYQRGSRGVRQPESVLPQGELPLRVRGPQHGPVVVRCGGLQITLAGGADPIRLPGGTSLTPCWDGFRPGLIGSLAPDEHIYGLGAPDQNTATLGLDRRGAHYDLFNAHQPRPSRLVLPVFYSSHGYGLLLDNSWPAHLDLGADAPDRWVWAAEGGDLDLYLLAGRLPQMVAQLTALTGRPALPPRWTLGFVQSKFGYRDRAEVEALAAEFRRRHIPCDGLILDLYWFKRMGDLRFDEAAFPEPQAMLAGLRQQGFQVITIQEPYITRGSRLFAEGKARGYFARFPDGRVTFPFWFADDEAALVDFTNPRASEWWTQQYAALIQAGIAGWWLDLNEPEQHYPDLLHQGGPAAQVHNRFAMGMIAAVAEAMRRYAPGRRCFIMSRSGWLGMARYGAGTWSGDVTSSFPALAQQPALGLGMGLAGIPGWNSDVGGFQDDPPTPELYARWLQFGAFCALTRPHAAHQSREPWAFGARVERIAAHYLGLRQRLMPYTYGALREAFDTGAPLLRPLVWSYPDDPAVADMADEYLYGPDLLIAPVTEAGARTRRVYLPPGQWYDFATRASLPGGQWHTVAAPLERLPIFVRAGAVVPLAPLQEHDAGPPAALTLGIWPGEATAGYRLYEDDGASEAYQKGVYATTAITVTPGATGIRIGKARGPYAAALPRRTWRLEVVQAAAPHTVAASGRPLPAAASARALDTMAAGWHFDAAAHTLHVKLAPGRGARQVEIRTAAATPSPLLQGFVQ